jgi:hypothetical protein
MNVDEVCLAAPEAVPPSVPARGSAAAMRWVFPLELFDLEAFLDLYWQARKGWDEPPLALDRRGKPLMTLDDHPDEWADEVLVKGRTIFLPAHERATDDPFCVGGCRHDGDALGLGLLEGYGYVVKVTNGVVTISTARYDAGSFTVQPERPGGSLASCLANFVGQFIRRG